MTDDLPRYSVFHDPEVATLGQTLERFESFGDETSSRKARVRSAVATFCRLSNKSASEILHSVFNAADAFTAGAPQHDDMTLLVLKLER